MPIYEKYEYKGFAVTVRSDDYFFTIYDLAEDRPRGTMQRPSKFYGNTRWVAHNLDGERVAATIGPRSCLIKFVKGLLADAKH